MKTQTMVSKLFVIASGLSITGLITACAPTGFQSIADLSVNKRSSDPVAEQCVPDTVDYLWDVNIYGFGLSGFDFDVSYNGPVAGPITKVGLGAKIDKGTLNLEMDVRKPYEASKLTVPADTTITSGFDFTLDVGIVKFGVGSSSDAQAAMIKLTSASYQKLLNNATSSLAKDPNPWSTHIVRQLDKDKFIVPVGSFAGLAYGDTFDVYKYQYDWVDSKIGCSSGAIGGWKVSMTPIATLTTYDIRDGNAILQVVGTPTSPITVNDLIEVKALRKANRGDRRANLKKSVRIVGLHQPNHITIVGAGEIDLTSYLNYQMQPLMNNSAFWVP